MHKAVDAALKHLQSVSKRITDREEIRQIATVSANWDDSIADIVVDAMEKVGRDGIITVEEAKSIETALEVTAGLQFDKGYLSPYFVTNPENEEARLDDAYILVYEGNISSVTTFLPLLEKVAGTSKPLLVVAATVDGEALATLVTNKIRGNIKVCAVKAPAFGERQKAVCQDIAIATGGKFISEDLGVKLQSIDINDLGRAKTVVVNRESTFLLEGYGAKNDVQSRIDQIRSEIEATTSSYDREKLQERLANLSGGIAVIKVGGLTEAEIKEKKVRVQNAVQAARAAMEEGIVPGGGLALIRCQPAIKAALGANIDENVGVSIVASAIEAPAKWLARNGGWDGRVVVEHLKNFQGNQGFNAAKGVYEDLFQAGVVDPHKVTRHALQNACSVIGLFLATECLVTESAQGRDIKITRRETSAPYKNQANATLSEFDNPFRLNRATPEPPEFRGVEPPEPPKITPPESELPFLPSKPNRYLVARVPDRIKIDVPFTLTARVVVETPSSALGQADVALTEDVTGKLTVCVYARGFESNGPLQREIEVPPKGDSSWAPFELVARHEGNYEIEVLAWKNSVQVGGITLSIPVGRTQFGPDSVNGALEFRNPEKGEHTFEISFDNGSKRFRFQLRSDDGETWPPMYSEVLEGGMQKAYKETIDSLNVQARNLNKLGEYAQREWLEGMGALLYKNLLPSELKQIFWERRDRIKFLNLFSTTEPMPWELLYLSHPETGTGGHFIANTATVSRWVYGPPACRQISRSVPCFVIPDGAPQGAAEEVTYVKNKIGEGPIIFKLDDFLKLLKSGRFSVLHFASHNVIIPSSTGGLYIPFQDSKFDITFTAKWTRDQFRSFHPLVFMNCCTSGGTVPLYTTAEGWATRFLASGSGAFIGSLWEIRTKSARTFAETFYDNLNRGENFGRSIRMAKSALPESDPTHLAYTFYGNPFATLL